MGSNILRRPSLANQPLSVFLQRAQEQRIQHLVLQDQSLKVAETDGSVYTVQTPRYFNAIPLLEQNRIPFEYVSRPPEAKNQLPLGLEVREGLDDRTPLACVLWHLSSGICPLTFVLQKTLQKKIAPPCDRQKRPSHSVCGRPTHGTRGFYGTVADGRSKRLANISIGQHKPTHRDMQSQCDVCDRPLLFCKPLFCQNVLVKKID